MKPPKIPSGWRKLRKGEIIQSGDLFWCVDEWYPTSNLGRPAREPTVDKPLLVHIRQHKSHARKK